MPCFQPSPRLPRPGRPLALLTLLAWLLLPSACLPNQRLQRSGDEPAATGPETAATPIAATTTPPAARPTSPPAPAGLSNPPPPLAREFRAAWVATVDNIDFPSQKGLPTAAAMAELDAIVDRAADLGLNALVFQVRPSGDAFYASGLEPWSEWLTGAQGRAPKPAWDPLAYVIERCRLRGLQLHAWFNPYRAAHPAGKSKPAKNHVLVRDPSLCVKYGAYRWMDPGLPRAADQFVAVLQDVVSRYDVDGVHIDDYFYPYPEKNQPFPDDASYAAYQRRGGKLARDDWRRDNVDQLVQRMYEVVHRTKPWVQVGISPFGIARPGVPAGIQAGIDQFGQLYADVPKWLQRGWLDYLAPQLYWPIDQKPQSFAVLLPWWHQQNTADRHVWPGINPGRALQAKPPIRSTEITDQIALLRAQPASHGHVHFSFKALRSDAPNVAGALRRLYAEPAAAPASPWLGATPPSPLTNLAWRDDRLTWRAAADTHQVAVQAELAGRWRTLTITHGTTATLPTGTTRVALTPLSRTHVAAPPQLLTP